MKKTRLIIPLIQHFTVRYLVRTGMLERITDFAEPLVLLNWEDMQLKNELEQLGAEVYRLPLFRHGVHFDKLKSRTNFWFSHSHFNASIPIDRRRKFLQMDFRERLLRSAWEFKILGEMMVPGNLERQEEATTQAFWADTNAHEIDSWFQQLQADALFSITPIVMEEEPLLRIAKHRNLKTATAILSFDNLTTRGQLPIIFDAYYVWNQYNAKEVRDLYPEAKASSIEITGPPQFDFYWDKSYVWDVQEWRTLFKLPFDRPVILFGAGFHRVVPNEPHWLGQLDDAISSQEIPGNPIILFRRHPNDNPSRWDLVLSRCKNVVCDEPWQSYETQGKIAVSRRDIEKLASTLYHSVVHINASSTLSVDGAIYDRPQIGPAYDDRRGRKYDRTSRELYQRTHYLPITNSGGLDIAYSREQMIHYVKLGLEDPARQREERKKLVRDICTFDDGKCTERVVQALRKSL